MKVKTEHYHKQHHLHILSQTGKNIVQTVNMDILEEILVKSTKR